MTVEDALRELLARVSACEGDPARFTSAELAGWPSGAVTLFKKHSLLTKAEPSDTAVCPGCEMSCLMPVHWLSDESQSQAFVVCDKREDINRVPVSPESVEQWQAAGESLAALVADLCGVRRPESSMTPGRWEVGVLRGKKHSAHMVLGLGPAMTLELAGHSADLESLLRVGRSFSLDVAALRKMVDHPIASGGDEESAAARRKRLRVAVQAEKNRGNKAFLKTVSQAEAISLSRLKQILAPSPSAKSTKSFPPSKMRCRRS